MTMTTNINRRSFLYSSASLAALAALTSLGVKASAAGTNVPTPITYVARTRAYAIGKTNRYIDAGDKVTITDVSSDGSCVVSYPTSKGTRQDVFWLTDLMPVDWFSAAERKYTAQIQFTTYSSVSASSRWGYVSSGDIFCVFASEQGYYWILYPTSSGYKLAVAKKDDVKAAAFGGESSQSSSSTSEVHLNVPYMSQTDSAWYKKKIGSKTIGQVGCLVTSLAMHASFLRGYTVTPLDMMNELQFQGNSVVWASVPFTVSGVYNCACNEDILAAIENQLVHGSSVIIGGAKASGAQHWVVVTGSGDARDPASFTINDPNSMSRTNLAQFLSRYPTVLRLIY